MIRAVLGVAIARLGRRPGQRRRRSASRSGSPSSCPATVAAHTLNATYASRLPLAVYLVGAATTVALSFIFVIVRDVRAAPAGPRRAAGSLPPAWLRYPLRAIGLLGWVWIIAQGIAGGSSDGDVATLFLWVYGWVGLAIVCALVGPVVALPRSVLDAPRPRCRGPAPARGRGLGDRRLPGAARPLAGDDRLRVLRLARARDLRRRRRRCSSSSSATRRFTLAMMAQFGRDEWRSHGETFTVWFRLLGRLAYWRLVDEDGRVHRRDRSGAACSSRAGRPRT